jgi:hypothetical protein
MVDTVAGSDIFAEAQEQASLGYDFSNEQTLAQLRLMDDLQRSGISKYIDLPQVRNLPMFAAHG